MNKIKIALTKVKNDFKENPATYVVAAAAGITVGVVTVLIIRKNDENAKSPLHLEMTQQVGEYLRDNGVPALFETSIGNFELTYMNE